MNINIKEFVSSVLKREAGAILRLSERIGQSFEDAVNLILCCEGRVIVSGMGKAGLVARKISATFSSTGTPSFYLHPAEAIHGDLGMVTKQDCVIILSKSGETYEVLSMIDGLKSIGTKIVAITQNPDSSLARFSDCTIDIGDNDEVCPMGLAPTTSTTVMLACGDALAMAVLSLKGFNAEDFARFHPGGAIGKRLMRVETIMRRDERNPIVKIGTPLRDVIVTMTETPGRPGAAQIIDSDGRLVGIFTDGDLRRLCKEDRLDLDTPIEKVMCHTPKTVTLNTLLGECIALFKKYKIDQISVVDDQNRPVGLLDVQDVVNLRA